MDLIFLLFSLSCAETKIINESKYPWNKKDDYQLEYSKKRCKQIYKSSPCLKTFIKRKKRTYWAICGKENG